MKILYYALLLTGLIYSCQQEPKEDIILIEEIEPDIPAPDKFQYDTLQGIYTGDFNGSPIRIVLNYVSANNAIGYNVHKGLKRNLNGKVRKSNDSIYLTLKEPGDHEFDGVFELFFIGIDNEPTGKWESNSGELAPKKLKLEKKNIEQMNNEEFNALTLPRYMGEISDSIGDYNFLQDGLVKFRYYPTTDDNQRVEQYEEIKGSWMYKDSIISVDWQSNSIFPDKRTQFRLKIGEWENYYLEGPFGVVESYYF